MSETLQVQTPAVPPGQCQPPRLVGKPKAREVQLRWGESFLSNLDLCGMHLWLLLMHLFVLWTNLKALIFDCTVTIILLFVHFSFVYTLLFFLDSASFFLPKCIDLYKYLFVQIS